MAERLSLSVSESELQRLICDLLLANNMARESAKAVAAALVWADMRGVHSHGISRLERYLEWIGSGEMNPQPSITVVSEMPTITVFDADRAAGAFAMTIATDRAIERAKQNGVALSFVKATTHTAALGYYTERAALKGVVCIAMVASGPTMAYHGSRAAGVSTSPLSIAAPGGKDGPVVFDMGTGIISLGKLVEAARAKQTIPEGWALDGDGAPTTDAATAVMPLPLGGPKGSGLSLMIEIVVSLLCANPILSDAIAGAPDGKRHRQNGLIIALDVARFSDPAFFAAEVQRLSAAITSLAPVSPDNPILLPGERGAAALKKSRQNGILLSLGMLSRLSKLTTKYGVIAPWLPA